jgi:hypothetical protein
MVIAVDLQGGLLGSIEGGSSVLRRSEYLLRCAEALGIASVASSQNAAKLGPIAHGVAEWVDLRLDKESFSCWRDPALRRALEDLPAKQVILCGVETHICVSLTVQDLIMNGYSVVVCPDAVGASTIERHKLGMERNRDAGAVPIHTEAVVYEWLQSSSHPKFRELLALTKLYR